MNDQNQPPNQAPAEPPSSPTDGRTDGSPTSINTRARWLIISVLLLVALGLGGWLVWRWRPVTPATVETPAPVTETPPPGEPPLSPTTPIYGSGADNDISDWQIYRNDEFGFEFKYPAFYTAKTENDGKNTIVFASDILTFGVFVVEEQHRLGVNEYNFRFSGNDELFKQIFSTFQFIE